MITTTKEFLDEISFKAYDQLAENFGKDKKPDSFKKFKSLELFEETYDLVCEYLLEEGRNENEHNELVKRITKNLNELSDRIGFSYDNRRTVKVKYIYLCDMIDYLSCK